MKYDLSILIPSRNEMFVAETVKDILSNIRGNTEIIVVLDGQLADPEIEDAKNLTILYLPKAIGQRAATNQAARLSTAKYVMKLDAHCRVDEGFDIKLITDMQTLGASGGYDHYTIIPTLYNLHGFDWVCIGKNERSGNKFEKEEWFKDKEGCGNRIYQSPTPEDCSKCKGNMERQLVFKPRFNKQSMYYRFDKNLHFQYWGAYRERVAYAGNIVDIMSTQGSCFFLTRQKYWELNICDEKHGSWGQQGVEVACKTWLSGGRLVTTKNTWYSHMFRTQGSDFGFPYPLSGSDQEKARKYSRWLWQENNWPNRIHDLDWLLEKFKPVPDWHDMSAVQNKTNKGIIFYTDNQMNVKVAHKVQKQLMKMGLPIVSTSLKPMPKMGHNIHVPLQRGYLTMFKQQLAALEASKADIIFFCEHDVLYHPSHFEFTPPRKDTFYYNINVWKVNNTNGHFVRVNVAQQVSGLCAYRELLITEYRNRVNRLEREGRFERGWGFEPGTKGLARGGFSNNLAINWESGAPNIDIRGDWNLTQTRWSPTAYRNPIHALGWQEADGILGWPYKNYFDILNSI